MSRRVLIAGSDSALLHAIEAETAKRVEYYTVAPIRNRFSVNSSRSAAYEQPDNSADSLSGRIPLEWNPGSPIAARTLVLAAENRIGQIDEAILVCNPPVTGCDPALLHLADVEILANDHVKGWFYLVRELSLVFRGQEAGILALVFPEAGSKDETIDLLGSAALAVFRSLIRSLLTVAINEPYFTMGFSENETGDEAGFAAFISRHLEECNRRSNGKLHKYGKHGFFK
ncbi:MAG: hypothetical protein FWG89_10360 [Treponema sp.]|nr:hypothetical protein [Treponema sp.]